MIILAVVISLSILILVHELGHFLTAKFFGVRVDEFGIGFPPRLFKKKMGDTTYSFNLLPFGGFVKIYGEDGGSESPTSPLRKVSRRPSGHGSPTAVGESEAESQGASETLVSETPSFREARSDSSFADQPVWKRSVIVLAGIFMNVILGWLVLSIVFMLGAPEHLAVNSIAPDSPAKKANLKEGDIILAAKYGEIILGDPVKTDDFIALVKQAGEEVLELKIQRGKEKIDVSLSGRTNPPPGQGSLGVSLTEIGFGKEPFFKGLVKGFETTVLTFRLVAAGFLNLIAKIFVTPKVIETLTGPVGIFTIATQAGLLGGAYLLQLLALISINLAVLNLIPFPALDGGRFLFLIIEKIKGGPISRRFQIIVNAAGFAALIILMIAVTIQDLGRIF